MAGIRQEAPGIGQHADKVTQNTQIAKAGQLFDHAGLIVIKPPCAAVLDLSGNLRALECAHDGIQKGVVTGIQTVQNRTGQGILPVKLVQQLCQRCAAVIRPHAVKAGIRANRFQHFRIGIAQAIIVDLHGDILLCVFLGTEQKQCGTQFFRIF